MHKKIIKIVVIILFGLFIFGLVLILSLNMNASAGTWTQSTRDDFNNGETCFVQVGDGTIKLAQGLNQQWSAIGENTNDNFGISVASAGDVNGDGYDDVIVGAYAFSSYSGKAYVYHGSSTGLNTTANWNVTGESSSNYFGWSVASAGDVNRDGYDDVIVGAYRNNDAGSNAGEVYVYFGSVSGLSSSPDWSHRGETAGDYFGYSVATARDVNGDGYDDIIIGAYGYSSNKGKAYIFHGSSTGVSTTASWTASGEYTGDKFGYSVSTAGDINGDGYDDVIIGASYWGGWYGKAYAYHGSSTGLSTTPDWSVFSYYYVFFATYVSTAGDVNGDGYDDVIISEKMSNNKGKTYLYYGSSTGLSSTVDWFSIGENSNDYFGYSVSSIDINSDGFSDVLIGAYGNNDAGNNAGKMYLYYGSLTGLSTTAVWTANGECTDNRFGYNVASAGDVNGDGYDDVIVGAYKYNNSIGKAYLYRKLDFFSLEMVNIWNTTGENTKDIFGYSVASAGDVNGDGFDDVIIGARQDVSGTGKAYVYHGSSIGLSLSPNWIVSGEGNDDSFGYCVASAGDVNGDGYDDVIVGARNNDDGGGHAGKAYIYYGTAWGLSTTAGWTATGEVPGAHFGSSVATAGDVNGDGYDDVVIGAPHYNSGVGKVYIYHGSSNGLSTKSNFNETGIGIILGYKESTQTLEIYKFGISVSTAGDVNGDGYDDVIIGSFYFTNENTFGSHQANLFFGNPSEFTKNIVHILIPKEMELYNINSRFGETVATAGDINGDGFDEVIIGESHYDNGSHDFNGKIYVTDIYEDWEIIGDWPSGNFGSSVSTAGDVNGDGFDEVIVGAPNNDVGGNHAGKVYVYYGALNSLNNNRVFTAIGENEDDRFGSSVSTAGDINGDGFDEVIVGAPWNNDGGEFAGKAYVFSLSKPPGFIEHGCYISEPFSISKKDYIKMLSISWQPVIQPKDTSVKFHIGTSNDGEIWTYSGPDCTSNSYYTNPHGEIINSSQNGKFWRYKAFLSTTNTTRTPTITSVTINYELLEKSTPRVHVISPNGGEDWLESDYYPITWTSEGNFNSTPVCLYYSTNNGDSWTSIDEWIENNRHYNWTVPNIETANAMIKVMIIDIYNNTVLDTSDTSFAIDPPPPNISSEVSLDNSQNNPSNDEHEKTNNIDDSQDDSNMDSQKSFDKKDGTFSNLSLFSAISGCLIIIIIPIMVFILKRKTKKNKEKTEEVKK